MKFDIKCMVTFIVIVALLQDGQANTLSINTTIELSGIDMEVMVNQSDRDPAENLSCVFDWGDGGFTVNYLDPDASGVFTRLYDQSGYFNVQVICIADDRFQQSSHAVYCGEFITRLTSENMLTVAPPMNQPLTIPVEFATGTHVTVDVALLHTDFTYVLEDLEKGKHEVDIPVEKFAAPGVYAVQINASNPVSSRMTIYSIVAYMEPADVTDLTYAPNNPEGSTIQVVANESFSILATLSGDDITATWQIERDDGGSTSHHDWIGFYCQNITEHTFTYSFSNDGDYIIKLQASNFGGSHQHSDINIKVHALNNVTIVADNVNAFTNESLEVSIVIDESIAYVANTILCDVDYGDEDVGQEMVSFYLNDTVVMDHVYANPGEYYLNVTCYPFNHQQYINYLPDQFNMNLTVVSLRENKVENLELFHDSKDLSEHPISSPLTVWVDLPDGSPELEDLLCSIQVLRGKKSVLDTEMRGDLMDSSNLTMTLPSFPTNGRLSVNVNCSKRLSWQDFPVVQVDVYYDCWMSNYFDDVFRASSNPRTTAVNEHYKIIGDVKFKDIAACTGDLELKWKVYDNDSQVVPVDVPIVSTFSIKPYTLPTGQYRFELTTTLVDMTPPASLTDHTWIKFTEPGLHVEISDGIANSPVRKANRRDTIVLDAVSKTYDPAENPEFGDGLSNLHKEWTCYKFPEGTTEEDMSVYTLLDSMASDIVVCSVTVLTDKTDAGVHYIAPYSLEPYRWYMFEVKVSSQTRSKIARQAIYAYDSKTLTLQIKCVSNCKDCSTARNKLRQDKLQLNAAISETVTTPVSYRWTFERFNPNTNAFDDVSNKIRGSREKTGMLVPGSSFENEAGNRFQATLKVKPEGNADFAETTSYRQFVLNMPPYNGSCYLDDPPEYVAAGYDYVCIVCQHWLDEGKAEQRNVSTDSGNSLTYEVVQRYLKPDDTIDRIYKETKLDTSPNLRRCVTLSLPEEDVDNTMIEVRVRDAYEKAFAKQQFIVKIKAPAMTDVAGSDDISELSQIMETSVKRMNQAIQAGNTHHLLSTIKTTSSVLSRLARAKQRTMSNFFKLSVTDGMNTMKRPLQDQTNTAVLNWKRQLSSRLKKGSQIVSSEAKTDPENQGELVDAATDILKGDEETLDNDILDETASVVDDVIDSVAAIAKQSTDSSAFEEFTEKLVHSSGALSDAIVSDDISYYTRIKTEAEARHVTSDLTDLDPDGWDMQEESILGKTEREYFTLKEQQQIALKLKNRTEQSANQSKRIESMLSTITEHFPVGDGVKLTIGDPTTSKATLTLTRLPTDGVGGTTIDGTQTSVTLPAVTTSEKTVTVGMYEGKVPVKTNDDPTVTSLITSDEVYVNMDMDDHTFEGEIDVNFQVEQPSYTVTETVIKEDDADALHRQKVYVRSTLDSFCVVVKPVNMLTDSYSIWISCSGDVSKLHYDAVGEISAKTDWKQCFSPSQLKLESPGVCKYGIETKLSGGLTTVRRKRSTSNDSSESPVPLMNITAATMTFLLWDDVADTWAHDKCSMTWMPEEGVLKGKCPPRKKMTFANSFYVPPNRLDFHSAFLKFSPQSQAAVLATLTIICILYVLAVMWARHVDKEDLLKWGITPLTDNFAEDNYFYILKVYTGLRPGAGTRSRVGFVAGGEDSDTGLRELYDGVRKEFATGSVMNFLLAVPTYLGPLEYIRVWHDNSGRGNGASWYLSRLEMQDVQRNETFSFLVERWLALDRDDGHLECVVPVCKVENLNVFRHRFNTNAKETLADSHIWISILYRPVTSHFTRVQRTSCALVFLMLTMISNAMFYQSHDNYENPAIAQVGPFQFTMQQVYISIICVLITTPTTLLLVYLFKLARGKPQTTTQPFYKMLQRASRYRIPLTESWLDKKYRQSIELEKSILAMGTPKYEGFFLPHWFAIIAWVLVCLTVLLCSFFLLVYSMEWGKQKSEEWLTAFFLTFFESVFCLDPIKIIATALLLSLVMRSTQDTGFVIDRQTIMKTYKANQRGKSGGLRIPAPPLDNEMLAEARAVKERELRMTTALRDIAINVAIIWISYSLSHATRDSWSYNMHQEIVDTLLQPRDTRQMAFMNIKTTNDYFTWLNKTAIVNMFPETDASKKELHWRMRQFLQDGAKLRVGPPRLRQLRTTKHDCKLPFMGDKSCYGSYSESTEDDQDYCLGWRDIPCNPEEQVYKHSSAAWRFTSAFDIWGMPVSGHHTTYGGGGYITKLSVNRGVSQLILGELYNSSWVDSQTRAVLFEFTLYCLNTNIFTYNIFMAEFPETGGVFPYVMILPLRLHMHVGALGMYTLVCEIIFLIYLVVISISTTVLLVRQKKAFFKKPWQVYDFVYICISYVVLVMYFIRMIMTNKSLEEFKKDPKEFVNFFHIALWDQIFVICIGILVFMATLRMLNVLGYNKRINTVANVFTNAASELLWFGIFFFYVYISYAVFGYLLFGSKLRSYKNVYKAMGTLFISMIGKSRFTEIEATDPVMSKIYFMIFIFFVVYMILTMFLAVLSQSIDQVHRNIRMTKRDEMVEYVINKFKQFLALYRPPKSKRGRRRRPPPLPWSQIAGAKGGHVDSKMILKDIRLSLKDALGIEKKKPPPMSTLRKLNRRDPPT